MKPSVQFLELLVNNPEQIFKEYILREENRRKGFKPVNYFFKSNKDNDINMSENEEILNIEEDKELEKEIDNYKNRKKQKITKKVIKKNENQENNYSEDEFYL